MHYPIIKYMYQMQNLRNMITQQHPKLLGKTKIVRSTMSDSMSTKVDSMGNAKPDKD